jgi:arylsulfatase A-like enzyme/Tfp pilus assembly protein PilF
VAKTQTQLALRGLAIVIVFLGALGGWWCTSRSTSARHPNLILITIDTLRADHLGVYGSTSGATPALDALAEGGVRFDQAQTAVPLTGPSHATILTGQYPPVHGVRGNVVFNLGTKYPTLATLLKRQGYRTAAFVGAYPVAAAFGFNQGFDTFDEEFHESIPGETGAERQANEVIDAALKWLGASGSTATGAEDGARQAPFFAWLHLYDPHAPYVPPSPYRERFAGHPYDGEIAFTDSQLARLFDWLRASGHDNDTYVMALADHGEGLGEHHELTHAVLVYQSTMRVPLIVTGPDVPHGRVVRDRVGTIDVLPTAMALVGFDSDKNLLGRDLRPLMAARPLAGEPLYGESLFGRLNCHWAALREWIKDDWKLIVGREPELYNLAEDPREQRNLAAEEPERVRRMTDELQRGLQRLAPGGDRAQTNPVTVEQEERLRSLGYTAGSGGGGALDDPGLPDPRTHVEYYDRLQLATSAQGPAIARAFEDVQAITRLDPNNPFAFGTFAVMAYRYGSLPVAAAAFARTLTLDPDRPGVRQNFGKLLRDLERYTDSERELRIALEQTTPDDSRTRVNLAETLIAEQKSVEADTLINDVLAREPQNAEALGAKGRLLIAQGRARDAVMYLERATTAGDPETFIELARGYLAAGDAAKARGAATEALRRNPDHPWAMAVLGHSLVLDGQRRPGVEYLQRAVAAGPRRPIVWEALAAGLEAAGNAPLAADCRRKAAAITGSEDPAGTPRAPLPTIRARRPHPQVP